MIKTIATEETGVSELIQSIRDHRDYLLKTGLFHQRERERLQNEFDHLLRHTLMENWRKASASDEIARVMEEVFTRKRSPGSAVNELCKKIE